MVLQRINFQTIVHQWSCLQFLVVLDNKLRYVDLPLPDILGEKFKPADVNQF